jgi:hypothetical protein
MRKSIWLVALCAVIFTVSSEAFAQNFNPQKLLAPIKKEFRANLSERLKLFIEYERTQQWDKLYDLSFGPAVEKQSKAEFVEWRSKTLSFKPQNWFVDFIPEFIDRRGDKILVKSGYRIIGAALVRESDKSIDKSKAVIYARYRDGNWYFSGFIVMGSIIEDRF